MYKKIREAIKLCKSEEWEAEHSSLARIAKGSFTYQQCREHACNSIASGLTRIDEEVPIVEIPKGVDFHFIGRVDTEWHKNDPPTYYGSFERRTYASFSTICRRNISHFHNGVFFIYDIHPEDIVHIFPMDSNTETLVSDEKNLTKLPSLWLTLNDLEELTAELGVYNQVTCRTKRNGQIIKPIAVAAFDEVTEEILQIAKNFGVKVILIHADSDAINYQDDIIEGDRRTLDAVSEVLKEKYGILVREIVLHESVIFHHRYHRRY